LDPKDGGSTPLPPNDTKLPHLFRGDEGWGGGKIQEGKCYSCSLVQFDFISFLFLELIVQFVQTILNSILG
jgi:hypothetical protein